MIIITSSKTNHQELNTPTLASSEKRHQLYLFCFLSHEWLAERQFLSLLGGVAWQEMKKWNEGAGGARRHVPQLCTPRLSWKKNCTASHTPPQCQPDTNLYLACGHHNCRLESLEGTFTMLWWTLACAIPMISSDIAARVSLWCRRFSPMDQAWKDVS